MRHGSHGALLVCDRLGLTSVTPSTVSNVRISRPIDVPVHALSVNAEGSQPPAQLRTVTQLTTLRCRCRTRAARVANLKLLTPHDLRCFRGIDRDGFAARSLHFRWKCVTKATTWRRVGGATYWLCEVSCWFARQYHEHRREVPTRRFPKLRPQAFENCGKPARGCCIRTTTSNLVAGRLAWKARSIWW